MDDMKKMASVAPSMKVSPAAWAGLQKSLKVAKQQAKQAKLSPDMKARFKREHSVAYNKGLKEAMANGLEGEEAKVKARQAGRQRTAELRKELFGRPLGHCSA